MNHVLKVLKPGLLTTIQDRGRFGYRSAGMPVAGAADRLALEIGNALLGNDADCAALEITLLGPELEVLAPVRVALAGAELGMTVNDDDIPVWSSFTANKGDKIRFKGDNSSSTGCRAYLCIQGGINVPEAFGSKSTDISVGVGGIEGRPLLSGDVLSGNALPGNVLPEDVRLDNTAVSETLGRRKYGMVRTSTDDSHARTADLPRCLRYLRPGFITYMTAPVTVRMIPGPQRDHFTDSAWKTLLESEYHAALDSNRVGVRLEGPILEHNEQGADILSEPISEGSIQVPASGQPIALLADRRTVGGYAKIATAISVDIPKLAQLRPGDRVRFQEVTLARAQTLLLEQRRWLWLMNRCWDGL